MRTIGFDYDGVIGNSRSAAWRAAERILASFGVAASIDTPQAMEAAFGHATQNALVGQDHAGTLRMMHRLLMRDGSSDHSLFEDVVAVVANLDAPRILMTAGLADGVITRLGPATRLFDEIIGFERGTKPDLMAQNAGRLCAYVTDTVSDIKTCKTLGLPVIACTWGTHDDPAMLEAATPDAIADSAAELSKLLNGFIRQRKG